MWNMIPSLQHLVHDFHPCFTDASFVSHCQLLLGWVMCSGPHTLYHVAQTIQADTEASRARRHPFDRFYNFFSRAAWSVAIFGRQLAIDAVVRLNIWGPLYLVVDDTLLHKRGKHVFGLGWFRDAVASTRRRVATASGNNWVVLGLAVPLPGTDSFLCLPLAFRLKMPGKGQPSCAALARELLTEVAAWFPQRDLILIGDGGYANKALLTDLPERVTFVGRMRLDAAVYEPTPRARRKSQRGPKAKKGPRLPKPSAAAAKADRQRSGKGPWVWQSVQALAYGVMRTLQVVSYRVVWPRVLGYTPVQVLVVRDAEGRLEDIALFTTNLTQLPQWVIETFARRWSIEVAFKASKQVMDIEGPQNWCAGSITKAAPWVWLQQSVIAVWYLTAGGTLPEAKEIEELMGPWDSKWSLRHMLRVLRRATLNATINIDSSDLTTVQQSLQTLKNCLLLAA
jgi:DDE superfamily endonuclease